MQITTQLVIKQVRGKVSALQNKYIEIDFIEPAATTHDGFQSSPIEWNNCYFPDASQLEDVKKLVDSEITATLSFLPIAKKVGDKIYHEIKMQVIAIAA